MHSYLRAIGFSKLGSEPETEQLLGEVFRDFDHRNIARDENSIFVEMEKEYGPDMGIILCGSLDREGFHREYYFPYYRGSGITTTEEVTVEKRVNGDSFAGVCEDGRLGVSLIFYLQNPAECQRERILDQLFCRRCASRTSPRGTS